jgi:anti-sigma factor RsiW
MLTDRCRQLLTASLDGELSNRERKAVLRLLHRSPEARALLRQLQQDSQRLRALPRQHLGAEFAQALLLTIAERQLQPHGRRMRRLHAQPAGVPLWAGMAVAASVLFLIGFGSFFYFAQALPEENPNGPVALRPSLPHPVDGKTSPEGVADATPPRHVTPPSAEGKDQESRRQATAAAAGPKDTADTAKSSRPADTNESALAIPIPKMELFQPRTPEVALPLIQKFAELDVAKLKEELQKDSGFRLELPCGESVHAFERLQAVLKAHNMGLTIDPEAQARLKQPKLHTNLVLYAEDLTAEDLVKVLQHLAVEDRKAEAKKRGEGLFDALVLTRMSKEDRKELSELLGIDPRQVQPPKVNSPQGMDPKVPLTETTLNQVTQTLTGQGGTPRSDANKPAAKAPDAQVLVLPYNPVRPRPGSAEVKRFLEARKPPRSGAVQLLLVLREMKG